MTPLEIVGAQFPKTDALIEGLVPRASSLLVIAKPHRGKSCQAWHWLFPPPEVERFSEGKSKSLTQFERFSATSRIHREKSKSESRRCSQPRRIPTSIRALCGSLCATWSPAFTSQTSSGGITCYARSGTIKPTWSSSTFCENPCTRDRYQQTERRRRIYQGTRGATRRNRRHDRTRPPREKGRPGRVNRFFERQWVVSELVEVLDPPIESQGTERPTCHYHGRDRDGARSHGRIPIQCAW